MTYGNQCVREYIYIFLINDWLLDKLTKEKIKNCLRKTHSYIITIKKWILICNGILHK